MKEVEIKAWILPEHKKMVEEYIERFACFVSCKTKNDVMYCKKTEENNTTKKQIEFRLREEISVQSGNEKKDENEREKKTFLVTRKTREYGTKGEEINEEIEFEIASKEDFHIFSLQLGYEIMYEKQKKVRQFRLKNGDKEILIEWVEMKNLGEFLEVEKVCETDEVENALQEIMNIIEAAGLENNIEKKPYGMLLGEF